MIFSTYWFLISAAALLPVYWLVRRPQIRLAVLLIFCFIFHAHFAGAAGVAPIICLGLMTYLIGRSKNKAACTVGIAICVLSLCFYKYTHFLFSELLSSINPQLGKDVDTTASQWLPA